jgi:hypothetical protein
MSEHGAERLAAVDSVEELLPYVGGQSRLGSSSSAGSLGVAVPTSAHSAGTSVVPARLRAVLGWLPHSREDK